MARSRRACRTSIITAKLVGSTMSRRGRLGSSSTNVCVVKFSPKESTFALSMFHIPSVDKTSWIVSRTTRSSSWRLRRKEFVWFASDRYKQKPKPSSRVLNYSSIHRNLLIINFQCFALQPKQPREARIVRIKNNEPILLQPIPYEFVA